MDTQELRNLLDEATPGPWVVVPDESAAQVKGYPCIYANDYTIVGTEGMYSEIEKDFANARLIALAPTLAAENLAMRGDIANLTASLAEEVTRSQDLRRAGDRMVAVASEARIVLAEHEPHPLPILGRLLDAIAAWEAAQ